MPSPSTRLSQIPPYLFGQIAALKARAVAEGRDLVDLGIGDPDQPTPEPIVEALYSAARNPETHRYDESPLGEVGFIEAVTRWFGNRFGVEIDPRSEALMLIGSKEGLAHLAWTYIDAGDVSLAPDPAYTVYRVNTLMAGGEVCSMPLLRERGFVPDLTAIPTDAARRAKLMWLNYPNNPTGATATLQFFREAVDFCRQYDIVLVNDAAYSEVTFDGYQAPSVLQVEGAKELAVEFHSFSKMFNMTGWRMGVALGCKDVISALNRMKSNIDSKQFPAVSRAAAYAIENVSNGPFLEVIRERRDVLVDGLASLGWDVERPKATFYVWAPIPGGGSSIEFASRLLEEAGVLAIPGVGYGAHGEGYIRMSLTVIGDQHGDRAREAVRRIKAAGIGVRA